MTPSRVLVALVAAVLTIAPASARSETQGAKKKAAAPKKILRLEELKVEGRIHKPQAMFLMPRANLNLGELERSEPLLPKVTEAAEKEPF